MKRDMANRKSQHGIIGAIQNNDKIGVIFSDRIEKVYPSQKGTLKHILYIIREMLDFHPESRKTDNLNGCRYGYFKSNVNAVVLHLS